jgi:hypothetical protein
LNFHRFAIVTFGKKLDGAETFSGKVGRIHFSAYEVTSEQSTATQLAVVASARGFKVQLNSNCELVVSEEIRRECEQAIEFFANITSVAHGVSRSISSPDPIIALSEITKSAQSLLQNCKGIAGEYHAALSGDITFNPEDKKLLKALVDRLEGVAILAEAHSTTHGLSRFREYIRFFELAFALPMTDLRKKLTKFLEAGAGGYSKLEIDKWVDLRHPSAHADRRRTKTIAFERDVITFVDRMAQAAYDVLFNKVSWHSSNIERRKLHTPDVYTTDGGLTPVITRGRAARINVRMIDCFGSYPMYLATLNKRPKDYWYPPKTPYQGSHSTKVRDA